MADSLQLFETEATPNDWTTPLADARAAVVDGNETGTGPLGLPAALLRERGSLKLYFYEPRGVDRQPPHSQDEVYVVVSGFGRFAIGESEESLKRFAFGPGDAIFAPAGAIHRFEDFTDDFGVWVVMYGQEGGEGPMAV